MILETGNYEPDAHVDYDDEDWLLSDAGKAKLDSMGYQEWLWGPGGGPEVQRFPVSRMREFTFRL